MSVNFRLKAIWIIGQSNIDAINVKMDGPVLEEKSSFKCLDSLYLLIWVGALTLALLQKLPSRKLDLDSLNEVWRSCIEYCCHAWVRACSHYLQMSDKLTKWVCHTAGLSLSASYELFAHCGNVANLSLFQ